MVEPRYHDFEFTAAKANLPLAAKRRKAHSRRPEETIYGSLESTPEEVWHQHRHMGETGQGQANLEADNRQRHSHLQTQLTCIP